MKGDLIALETELREVLPGVPPHQLTDGRKSGELVHLPDAIDIAGPSTARIGVTALLATQRQDVLEQQDGIHRIQGQLRRGQCQREQRLQGKRHDAQAL